VITNWVDPRTKLKWEFNTSLPGTYDIKATLKSAEQTSMIVQIEEKAIDIDIQPTQEEFSTIVLGEMEIAETGDLVLEIRPVPEQPIDLEMAKIELVKK
jgi:hypothetical protein